MDPTVIPITVGFAAASESSIPFQVGPGKTGEVEQEEAAAKLQKSIYYAKKPDIFQLFWTAGTPVR